MSGLLMRHTWPLALMRSAGSGPSQKRVLEALWLEALWLEALWLEALWLEALWLERVFPTPGSTDFA